MLNGFVGEFLILLGTYQVNWKWAAWAALGVILSACYLLWAYQRVFFGEVTNAKNKTLSDTTPLEKWVLVTMSAIMLWMGVGSPFITKRVATACNKVVNEMKTNYAQEAAVPSATLSGRTGPQAVSPASTALSTERLAPR